MDDKKQFIFYWDYEKDLLVAYTPNESKMYFTKEFLKDCSAAKFIGMLDPHSKPKSYTEQMHKLQSAMQQQAPQQQGSMLQGFGQGQLGQGLGQLGQLGQAGQGMTAKDQKAWQELMQAQAQALGSTSPIVKELHVYDLGEGMLVPVEMVKSLIGMFVKTAKPMFSVTLETIDDDLYGAPFKPAKVYPSVDPTDNVEKLLHMLGMKHDDVMEMDKKHSELLFKSQYLTDPNAFIVQQEQQVKIPKKPKQVTNQSLKILKKILGGTDPSLWGILISLSTLAGLIHCSH